MRFRALLIINALLMGCISDMIPQRLDPPPPTIYIFVADPQISEYITFFILRETRRDYPEFTVLAGLGDGYNLVVLPRSWSTGKPRDDYGGLAWPEHRYAEIYTDWLAEAAQDDPDGVALCLSNIVGHEMGHLLHQQHVDDPAKLMHETADILRCTTINRER